MGGQSTSESRTEAFDPEALKNIIQGLQSFSGGLGQQPSLSAGFQQLAQGGLTGGEQASIDQQLEAIKAGATGAEQDIQQSLRSQATAKGFGGSSFSRGELAQEAAQLANIPLFQAQQRANVFGQQGQLQRQGLLAGQQAISQQESQRQNLLGLQLQALRGAGGLAGIGQSESRTSGFQFGGLGGSGNKKA
jgi:hypothetical protein